MKLQHQSERKSRMRLLIQAGSFLQKSGLIEAFRINTSDDLQNYNNRAKATQLLGFLTECFEKNDFDEANLERWKIAGKKMLKGD